METLKTVGRFLRDHKPETLISLGIVAAAVLPGFLDFDLSMTLRRYDAALAVLAITAIAVVWYTGSTHRALRETRRARLDDHLRALQELHFAATHLQAALGAFGDSPKPLPAGSVEEINFGIDLLDRLAFVAGGRWRWKIKRGALVLRNLVRTSGERSTHPRWNEWRETAARVLKEVYDEVESELERLGR